jgi:Stress responsive A/B Barrel Domain
MLQTRFPVTSMTFGRGIVAGVLLLCCSACEDAASDSNATESTVTEPSVVTADTEPDDTADASPTVHDKGSAVNDPDRVLRHAVFFSFKEESTEDEIQVVVDAFRALPSKIPEIIDFEWGVNDSPEGLDGGFTHCFLLTFNGDAGRAAYLPHEQHKAFGDVLRPHMDQVFVIDYWGKPSADAVATPLHHAVFFKFKDDAAADDVENVESGFAELPSKIDLIKGFEWGTNNSPEDHSDDFTHCFLVTFDSAEARDSYIGHPDHKAFVQVLMPVLDKARVLDFPVQP